MCGFVQDNSDDFDWTQHMGSTSSSFTGPSADHTSGYGMNMDLTSSFLTPIENRKCCYL